MNVFISHVCILNFKSIRFCLLSELRRINVLIGNANAGKTNLLEALGIFSIPYIEKGDSPKATELVRIDHTPELFYDGNCDQAAKILTDRCRASLAYETDRKLYISIQTDTGQGNYIIDEKLNVKGKKSNNYSPFIRKCSFSRNAAGLLSIPSRSLSEGMQRLLFYETAITESTNAVLLLDNLEAHCFPSTLIRFTQAMIDNKQTQYILASHSPYIIQDLLENARDELAIFKIENLYGETIARRLSPSELHAMYQQGTHLFS